MKTFCGTDPYVAPEIWKRSTYTSAVDIWSLAVIVLEYGYGLPTPTRERKGIRWCQDICDAANDCEGEGDALIDFLSTDMLKMKNQDRLSTSDCLKKADRLGFLNMEIIEDKSMTSKGITVPQEYFTDHTNSPSILMEALRESSQDDAQVSLGKRCLKAAEQPLKKKLQTRSVCSNLGSGLEISAPAQDETTESKPEDELLEAWYTEYTCKGQKFRECTLNNQAIRMRISDKWICFTHLALAFGQTLG